MAVQVWDVTSDLGIPVFVSDIYSKPKDPSGLRVRSRGSGCHPDPSVALSRALTEAAQTRLTYIVGVRDDIAAAAYRQDAAQAAGGLLLDRLGAVMPGRNFWSTRGFLADDIRAEVEWQLECLRSAGLNRAIVIELTQPKIDIPVVRVLIPGLETDSADPFYQAGARVRAARSAGT
jgi:YcaO-like protein with predicted kinase domain